MGKPFTGFSDLKLASWVTVCTHVSLDKCQAIRGDCGTSGYSCPQLGIIGNTFDDLAGSDRGLYDEGVSRKADSLGEIIGQQIRGEPDVSKVRLCS